MRGVGGEKKKMMIEMQDSAQRIFIALS